MNIQSTSLCVNSSCSLYLAKENPQKRHKHRQRDNLKSKFQKPLSTPLLVNSRNQPQSKFQALDKILGDIEASFNNGVEIDDPSIFASLLEACFHLQAFNHTARIHRLVPQKLLRKNVGISSKLLRLYAADGRVEDAHQLFDQMRHRYSSAFPWNSLILGYVNKGLFEDALALYFQMVDEGVEPDLHTFPRVLKACAGIGLIQVGEEVHRHVIRWGFGNDRFVLNTLVDMYAKCGDIIKARRIFDQIAEKDLVSWNSMLVGYVRHDLILEALDIFQSMLHDGFKPDSVSVSALLSRELPLKLGPQIHGWVLRQGIERNLSIANSLLVLYSNSLNNLKQTRWLFENMPERDVVSWNSIISAHSKDREALAYFQEMVSCGAMPDGITFVSLLSVCAHLGMVEDGERIFTLMREWYKIKPVMEHYACLVNLYARAGLITKAYDLIANNMEFEAGPTVWGALLYSCSVCGNADIGEIVANHLFELEPDNEHNFELLVKTYRKAGLIEDAERVIQMMIDRGFDLQI
nr:pentatricopeptide repeat-containing protein At4g25270, chloroplastic [Ipomoea batatas]